MIRETPPTRLWAELARRFSTGTKVYVAWDIPGGDEPVYVSAAALRDLMKQWTQRGYTAADCVDQLEALIEGR